MRRFLLILAAIGLLLLAETLVYLESHAHGASGKKLPRRSISPVISPVISEVGFYYKTDESVRYLDLKNQWHNSHTEPLNGKVAVELSQAAYRDATVEDVLSQWRAHGGPHPWMIDAKAHLYNPDQKAYLNVKLSLSLEAKVGDLRVDPALQLVDFDYLNATAVWQQLPVPTQVQVDAIAPDEDILVSVAQWNLLAFLQAHPNQWPVALRTKVQLAGSQPKVKTLSLLPDHFLMPDPYSF